VDTILASDGRSSNNGRAYYVNAISREEPAVNTQKGGLASNLPSGAFPDSSVEASSKKAGWECVTATHLCGFVRRGFRSTNRVNS
jgi:hypothetical protein